MSSPRSGSVGNSLTNLQRFLQCVTPIIPSRPLPQSCYNDLNSLWQPPGKSDHVEYFTLKDLWDCYREWSALGIGAEVSLDSGETVMQYYVPYLSAIQLFSTKPFGASRNPREDGDGVELECDSWVDDSASDNSLRSVSNNSSKAWDALSYESGCDQEGSWRSRDKLGYPYLNYIEMSSPYLRVPLIDKITDLARSYRGLMTLKSVDLSPASWVAVAWYPIYHIPSQKMEKDLATCFLTFHTLSSSFQDTEREYEFTDIGQELCFSLDGIAEEESSQKESSGSIAVTPFGLATYKMQGDLWVQDSCDDERLLYLHSAADSWLKQLDIYHHDFNFFTIHSTL